MKKQVMEDLLANNDFVHLNYTKKDGDTREMEVTKQLRLVPEYDHPNTFRPYTGDLLTVYDMLADDGCGGWRAIDPERVEIISAYWKGYEI